MADGGNGVSSVPGLPLPSASLIGIEPKPPSSGQVSSTNILPTAADTTTATATTTTTTTTTTASSDTISNTIVNARTITTITTEEDGKPRHNSNKSSSRHSSSSSSTNATIDRAAVAHDILPLDVVPPSPALGSKAARDRMRVGTQRKVRAPSVRGRRTQSKSTALSELSSGGDDGENRALIAAAACTSTENLRAKRKEEGVPPPPDATNHQLNFKLLSATLDEQRRLELEQNKKIGASSSSSSLVATTTLEASSEAVAVATLSTTAAAAAAAAAAANSEGPAATEEEEGGGGGGGGGGDYLHNGPLPLIGTPQKPYDGDGGSADAGIEKQVPPPPPEHKSEPTGAEIDKVIQEEATTTTSSTATITPASSERKKKKIMQSLSVSVSNFDDFSLYEQRLLFYARSMEAAAGGGGDWSQGVGGSKAEYEAEKDFESVLTGGGTDRNCTASALPDVPTNCPSRWVRTLNRQETCYLYIHTTTHELRSTRPADYVGAPGENSDSSSGGGGVGAGGVSAAEEARERKRRAREAERKLAASFPSIPLATVVEDVRALYITGVVPLLLVERRADAELVASAFSQDESVGRVIDLRPMSGGTRTKPADCLEAARTGLVSAMKTGAPLLFDLGSRCPPLRDRIWQNAKQKAKLPQSAFEAGDGAASATARAVFIRAKGDGPPKVTPGYCCAVLAQVAPTRHENELGSQLYLEHMGARVVRCNVELPVVGPRGLIQWLDDVQGRGKIPLILDRGINRVVETVLETMKSVVTLNAKGLVVGTRTKPMSEVRESARTKLVAALKHGQMLHIAMKDAAPNFTQKLCDDDTLPLTLFTAAGDALDDQQQAMAERVYREADLESGFAVVRKGFRVVLTSRFAPEDYRAFFKEKLPLDQCVAARFDPEAGAAVGQK